MDEHILSFLSFKIKQAVMQIPSYAKKHVEEIRIRIGRPIELIIKNETTFLTENGELTLELKKGLVADIEDGTKIMNLISRHSVYAIEEELRRGYITVRGGHRVGITGRAVTEEGRVKLLKDIKSFNIRIAREVQGVANQVLPKLVVGQKFLSTLIISPPQCGKTTLLRDLIRLLSYGKQDQLIKGHKIGLVDERSEIAGCLEGIPQNDLGPRVDVLDACPKAEGLMMLIRSMSPEIVACDEIGHQEDTAAIQEAVHAGVAVLATAHGHSLGDIRRRPNLRPLFEEPVFDRYLILSRRQGVGTIEAILNNKERNVSGQVGGISACLK